MQSERADELVHEWNLLGAPEAFSEPEQLLAAFFGASTVGLAILDDQLRYQAINIVRERYEAFGYDGLFDRRQGKPSPKRVPVARVEQVLGLYRDRYFDLNVRHLQEKLQDEHQIELSYSGVKLAAQGAGLVRRGREEGVHRQRRPRRPLAGMLLHIDG